MRVRRDLRDMTVLITGASSGIGRALALQLAQRGARLVIAARRTHRLDGLIDELRAGGPGRDTGRHLAVPADVSDESQCRQLVDRAIEHFDGRLDTLVCNAGYGFIAPLWRTDREAMLELFRTNVLGATSCIRRAVPHMLSQPARGGASAQIVIVSSAVARRGLPGMGAYSATKAAQLAMAEALRVELRGSGVCVTSVHPALTRTEFFRVAMRRSRARPTLNTRCAQSPQHVALQILRAIERPRREVWPNWRYRLLTSLGTFAPGVADWVVWLRQRHRLPPLSAEAEPNLDVPLEIEESGVVNG